MPLHVYNFIKERVKDLNKYDNIKIRASTVDVSNNKLDKGNVDMAVHDVVAKGIRDDLVAKVGAKDARDGDGCIKVDLIEVGRAKTIVQVDE